jgi:predicted small secreted protein
MKTIVIIVTATFLLASCNTTIGIGRDLRKAGEGLSNTAAKVKANDSGATDEAQ